MRTATIMSKVFLHHLVPLITLQSFSELWLDVLDYIEKFMRIGSDMLHEAMRESLKNMLLVMHSVRHFFCFKFLIFSTTKKQIVIIIGCFSLSLSYSQTNKKKMRVFHNNDGVTHSPLWELTWKRVTQFLPNLKEELFDKDPSKILFGIL